MPRVAVIISASALLFFVSCGGRDTVAERSAAAYREAVEKGLPIEADHGGHGAHGDHDSGGSTDPAAHEDHDSSGGGDHAMAGHDGAGGSPGDYAVHGAAADAHGAAGHAATAAEHPAGHAAAGGTARDAAQHGAMQHGEVQPGEMQHGATGPSEHSGHAGMGKSSDASSAIPPGGLWGAVPGSVPARPAEAPALPMAPVPATNDEMKSLRPDITLAPDPADTPAAISVQEAKKATGEGGESAHPPDHSQHDTNEDARP